MPSGNPISFSNVWFEVNVRGARLEGLDDDGIDQLDDRRVRIDNRAVIRCRNVGQGGNLDLALRDVLDHLVHGIFPGAPIIPAERLLDVVRAGHARLDFHVQQVTKTVECVQVGGVTHRHRHGVIVTVNRDHIVLLGDVARDGGDDFIRKPHLSERDEHLVDLAGAEPFVEHGLGKLHDLLHREFLAGARQGCDDP